MKKTRFPGWLFGLFVSAGLMSATQAGGLDTCPRLANYQIEVRLDPSARQLDGTEVLTWRNYAPDAVRELPFHLYMNAFESKKSTFVTESETGLRGASFDEKQNGWCKIRSFRIDGLGDLTASLRFTQPDDGNASDHTVVEARLPRPVEPGETVTVRIRFSTKLPKLYARAGWLRDFYLMGQWFPKIGVLEPPGWRGSTKTRWNCHQYHRNSEFYANFGDYDVTFTVPESFRVGATGRLMAQSPRTGGKETTYRFRQEGVHDFAWAASPDFVEVRDRFEGRRDVRPEEYRKWSAILGVPEAQLLLPDVDIHILMHREHPQFIDLSRQTLKDAIKTYGLMFGPYPYSTITMVDPAPGAWAASGMEYPTFFTAGTHTLLGWWPFTTIRFESVITHEFGHNYWQGMAASNEFEESWLDEGINSFAEAMASELAAGPGAGPLEATGMSAFQTNRMAYVLARPIRDPLPTRSWKFYPGQYGVSSYQRPAILLLTLRNLMGPEHYFRCLRAFFQKYQFQHPTTSDFLEHFSADGGEPVRNFLKQAIYGTSWLDFAVAEVTAPPSPRSGQPVRSTARVVRDGDFVLPVDILFRFENGQELRRSWDGRATWTLFTFKEKTPLRSVQVDPDLKIPMDVNLANNSYTRQPSTGILDRWQAVGQFLAQSLFHLLSWFS